MGKKARGKLENNWNKVRVIDWVSEKKKIEMKS